MSTDDAVERVREQTGTESADGGFPIGLTVLAGVVALVLLSPLVDLFLQARTFGLEWAIEEMTRPSTVEVIKNSLALVAAVTVASVLVGVPLAVLTVQTDLPFRRFWTVAASLPLVIPSYIGAFTYVSAFGPRGVLAEILAPLGVQQLPPIRGFHGATLVLTLFVYPYVFLTTRAALLSMDGTLVEAARTLNHSRWEAFRRVTLPQITPGITAGALLVALYTLADFGTPTIMRVQVFTSMIYQYRSFAQDYAILLSIQLLAIAAVILLLESRIGAGETDARISRGASQPTRLRLGYWTIPALLFCGAVVALTLVVPVGVLLLWLQRSGQGLASGVGLGYTFELRYAWNSVYTSALTALISVLVAIPIAFLAARSESRITTLIERATYVGYAVPGIVLAIALIVFSDGPGWLLEGTVGLLLFAYVIRFMPQAIGTLRSSVLQVDPKLEEAARSLGYSKLGAFRRVTLPLIAPGIAAGAALVFLTTMKELPATLLLRPFGFGHTIVTYIWVVQEAAYYGQAALPALALICISAVSMLIILAREHYSKGSR